MQAYVDLRNIFETVNNEFAKRIEESINAKRSLEKELAKVGVILLCRMGGFHVTSSPPCCWTKTKDPSLIGTFKRGNNDCNENVV